MKLNKLARQELEIENLLLSVGKAHKTLCPEPSTLQVWKEESWIALNSQQRGLKFLHLLYPA